MQALWRAGGELRVADLAKATGLEPSSLYNTFGSRDALVVRCLDRYREHIVGRTSGATPGDRLRAWFSAVVAPDEDPPGCLIAAMADSSGAPDLREVIATRLGDIRAYLRSEAGDPEIGDVLFALHLGLDHLARTTDDPPALAAVADRALDALIPE